jgi:hypothetical protein
MKVRLNIQPTIIDRTPLAAYLETTAQQTFGHYGARMICIDALLAQATDPSTKGADDVECVLEAEVAGLAAVVVREQAAEPRLAMRGAIARLERAVARALDRLAPPRPPFPAAHAASVGID